MEIPTKPFKHALTQTVTVTGGARAMVSSAIALDRQHITSRVLWVFDGDIDEVTRRTHLRLNHIVALTQRFDHLKLKRRIRRFPSFLCHL
ncbi:hypothetical protein D3C85_1466130 [compost metagenome]